MLDAHGRVIGVSVGAFREGQNLNFAVPVEALSSLVDARQSLRPLSAVPRRVTRRKGSSASPTLGVEGTLFSWGSSYGYFGYSFTVRNHLQQSVTAVKCLLVFYDAQGRPVDFRRDELWPSDTIPPGLAKRHDYSGDMNSTYQVSERVEIRVLDFTIVH